MGKELPLLFLFQKNKVGSKKTSLISWRPLPLHRDFALEIKETAKC